MGDRRQGGELMHLPWYKVDEDAFIRGENLGRRLSIGGPHGVGIMLAVWRWAFKSAPDGDFSGRNVDEESLIAAAEWPAPDAPRLIRALQAAGFVATAPELRVRGLDRYRATWLKNRRNGHGEDNQPESHEPPPPPARVPPLPREEPARQTQTQTQTQNDTPEDPPRKKRAADPDEKARSDPRHTPMVKALCDAHLDEMGYEYTFGSKTDKSIGGRNAKAVTALLGMGLEPTIVSAWRRALKHVGFPTVRTLPELVTHWSHFVGPAPPPRGERAPESSTEGQGTITAKELIL
jgi:hypothetical protein